MKLQLCLEGTHAEILAKVEEFAALLRQATAGTVGTSAAASARRGPKAAPKQETFDFGEGGAGEEGNEETQEEAETLTLDEHVVPAFQALSKRGPKGKDNAIAILKKYKVKSVRDLPEDQFAEILELIKTK